ncbi:hypothetical protein JB92DRAFT_2833638 [Gautieria morchelliformis]|nr:hypothetical protein JB92DRAFT_2833638 [Gautieria morchelliformis]
MPLSFSASASDLSSVSDPTPSTPSLNISQSSGEKRARSPVEDSDNEIGVNGRKKRKAPEEPWRDWGHTCARVVDAFTDPQIIINTYLKSLLPSARPEMYTEQQKHILKSYELLVDHIPILGKFIIDCSPTELKELYKEVFHFCPRTVCHRAYFVTQLKAGQGSARQADTNGLKTNIIDMMFHPDNAAQGLSGLDRKVKITRGFHNDATGRLLCPVTLDWDDDSVKEKLRASPNTASTSSWPMFFYPNGAYEPTDMEKGLLRSELLVFVFKYIYTGPNTWSKPDGVARNTRSCNAVLAQMEHVTARSLAYVAAQARFALSSGETNQKVGGPFDLTRFFWHVVKYLEDPDFEEEVSQLLDWWNSRVLPSSSQPDNFDDGAVDSLAQLKAQKAAKRAMLANATNHMRVIV